LLSVDAWLMEISPSSEPDSPRPGEVNMAQRESVITKRMTFHKEMFLYTNLILLHRPHINDTSPVRNTSSRPSFDICSNAAILITDMVNKLSNSDLVYHSKSPMMVYGLVMAARIHVLNAMHPNPIKYNVEKNFYLCIRALRKLPQLMGESSMLMDTLIELEYQHENPRKAWQEIQENHERQRRAMQPRTPVAPSEVVFSQGMTDNLKGKFSAEASTSKHNKGKGVSKNASQTEEHGSPQEPKTGSSGQKVSASNKNCKA
jgi:hypothetical protein